MIWPNGVGSVSVMIYFRNTFRCENKNDLKFRFRRCPTRTTKLLFEGRRPQSSFPPFKFQIHGVCRPYCFQSLYGQYIRKTHFEIEKREWFGNEIVTTERQTAIPGQSTEMATRRKNRNFFVGRMRF